MANPRNRGPHWGTVLLGSQLMHVGLQNVPPVTLALIVGQTLVFLDAFPEVFPSPMDVCMSSYLVYHKQEWIRMIKGAFCHGDDMHLYFNMLSLLYKGSLLEKTYGSPYYAYMMTSFTGLTSATYVGLGLLLHKLSGDETYLRACAVGFSGVLFAMKVLVTLASPPGIHYIGPIPVPSRYIFWVELVLIQMAAPNASFVGHLAGILVGLAYAWGPLKYLMDFFLPAKDYRRNPTFETSSIFNREPPNLHDNVRMSQPPPPRRRSPQHRFEDQLGSRNSYTRANPSPPNVSSSYTQSTAHTRPSFSSRSQAYGGVNPNSSLYTSSTRVRPSAPYSSDEDATLSRSFNDKLYSDSNNSGKNWLGDGLFRWFR